VAVQAKAIDSQNTEVLIQYDMTALDPTRAGVLDGYQDPAFSRMIEDWERKIRERLPELLKAFA
jgi:hypothetical protein